MAAVLVASNPPGFALDRGDWPSVGNAPWKVDALPLETAAMSIPWDLATGASGHWYDVFRKSTGDAALLVGDAVGHGSQTEPLKTRLQRVAPRLVLAGTAPRHLLEQLRQLIGGLEDELATIMYAVVGSLDGSVAILNAGHPPPLVVHGNDCSRFLDAESNPALGAPQYPARASITRTRMRPGDPLVLYTDGLVDRPDLDLDTGMRHLAAMARKCAEAPLAEMCDVLACLAFEGERRTDDVTVLAIRRGDRTTRSRDAAGLVASSC